MTKFLDRIINIFLAVSLAVIVVLIFINVVLRYLFDTSIIWGPELSRYIFVWMTFIGAIAAMKNNQHLAVNILLKRLPGSSRKYVMIMGNMIVLYVLYLILTGSWKMTIINQNSISPATGLSLSVIYISGIVVSLFMGVIIINKTIKLLFNKINVNELVPPQRR